MPIPESNDIEMFMVLHMKVQKQNKHVQTHLNMIEKLVNFNLPDKSCMSFDYDK